MQKRLMILSKRKKIESFNAFIEKVSNSLNLNLDAESKTTITKANVPILVRKMSGNLMRGIPL